MLFNFVCYYLHTPKKKKTIKIVQSKTEVPDRTRPIDSECQELAANIKFRKLDLQVAALTRLGGWVPARNLGWINKDGEIWDKKKDNKRRKNKWGPGTKEQ